MAAKVICMASAKGGSGKTILTVAFGSFLAALGKSVLLLDTDAATNGLTLFYLKEVMLQGELAIGAGRKPCGIYEQISEKQTIEIIELRNGLYLLPATYSFINTEQVSLDDYQSSLSTALLTLRPSYDYIFLDAQSGSDVYAKFCMSRAISDEVVIVSEYDPISAAGVERLKGLLREDLTYERTWVLLNKMLPDFAQSFGDFLEVAKYLNPIPWDADVVRAYARRKIALDLVNGNEHTLAVMQTLRTLLGDSISSEVETWTKERAAVIRQPIEDQYKDIEKEVEGLMSERLHLEWLSQKRRLYLYVLPLTLLMVSLTSFIYIRLIKEALTSSLYFLTLILLTGVVALVMLYFVRFKVTTRSAEFEIQEARIRRRQDVLEEKLKKLEILRTADLETLVKSKSIT
jgi:cellulose biosynthesis protein BcsQ